MDTLTIILLIALLARHRTYIRNCVLATEG